jgi:hypothetical protein
MGDMPSMPIGTAAISWTDSGGTSHIRVYSTDGYKVVERCWDGSAWTTGGFSASGSQVSAICWLDDAGEHIRVYCTFQDKTLEYALDPGAGWYQGAYTI